MQIPFPYPNQPRKKDRSGHNSFRLHGGEPPLVEQRHYAKKKKKRKLPRFLFDCIVQIVHKLKRTFREKNVMNQINSNCKFVLFYPRLSPILYISIIEMTLDVKGASVCFCIHRDHALFDRYMRGKAKHTATYSHRVNLALYQKKFAQGSKYSMSKIQYVLDSFRNHIETVIQERSKQIQVQHIANTARSKQQPQHVSSRDAASSQKQSMSMRLPSMHEWLNHDADTESQNGHNENENENSNEMPQQHTNCAVDGMADDEDAEYAQQHDDLWVTDSDAESESKEEETEGRCCGLLPEKYVSSTDSDADDEESFLSLSEDSDTDDSQQNEESEVVNIANNQAAKPIPHGIVQQHEEKVKQEEEEEKKQSERKVNNCDHCHDSSVDIQSECKKKEIEPALPAVHEQHQNLHHHSDNDDNNNNNNGNQQELKQEDDDYAVNENLGIDQPNPQEEVQAKIALDTRSGYDRVSKGFNDFYASDADNFYEQQEPQQPVIPKQAKIANHLAIDGDDYKKEKKQDEEEKKGADQDDDNKQFEIDEQKEEPVEEMEEEKTYVYPREYQNIGPVFSYGKHWPLKIKPKYKHLKEEVLNNKYAKITEKTWNGVLKKCNKILKGEFSSKRKNRWSKLLRENGIRMKHLVALKLYTDFDLLQREFRKSFRAPYNQKAERLAAFCHWRETLKQTFKKFTEIPSALAQPETLFHGINSVMCLDQFDGTYHGPCSTTTDIQVARSFAGKNGMILVMKPEADLNKTDYKVLDISWISDYPDEREYLLFDHNIEIESWILSSDYDQYFHYYKNILVQNIKLSKGPPGHLSYEKQKQIPKYLAMLKQLRCEVEIKPRKSDKKPVGKAKDKPTKFKQNVDFGLEKIVKQDKLDLLVWIFGFVKDFKYGKKKPSKFDQSVNANLQHVMKQIHVLYVPPTLVNEFMARLREVYQKEMSAYFIRTMLNEYFVNTYSPLDAAIDSNLS